MDSARRSEDPYEVVTRTRSAALLVGTESAGGFAAPDGPLRAPHVRMAHAELEQRGRATFYAERWATQPVAARARVIWHGWAQSFAASLRWENDTDDELTPRMRERLDELTALLSGPATRGELRVLESYEAYFQVLFTLGWALVKGVDPLKDARRLPGAGGNAGRDPQAAETVWNEIRGAWIAPWVGRRRHDQLVEALMIWVDPPRSAPLEIAQENYAQESVS
jgi:hypothetical protein